MAKIELRSNYMRLGEPPFTAARLEIAMSEHFRVGGSRYGDIVTIHLVTGNEPDGICWRAATSDEIKEKAVRMLQQALQELRKWNG